MLEFAIRWELLRPQGTTGWVALSPYHFILFDGIFYRPGRRGPQSDHHAKTGKDCEQKRRPVETKLVRSLPVLTGPYSLVSGVSIGLVVGW